ncbi:hypothetical protein Avbf_01936 [Armadillidium vulgare]|nr:hypothetical protein Avbf_01936 [Armadillidium vulgare]
MLMECKVITYTLGVPLAIIFSSHFVVPVLYPLKLISINEYIELRFKSKLLRLVIVLNYNIYGLLLVYFLTFSCGLVAYASYAGCDPMALGIITKKDQIMTYFVTDKLSFIP